MAGWPFPHTIAVLPDIMANLLVIQGEFSFDEIGSGGAQALNPLSEAVLAAA